MMYDLILKRRTIRKFLQKKIPKDILKKLVNAARLAPSAANLQPVEFIAVDQTDMVKKIFGFTEWAGYIEPEGRPKKGEEPVSFIIFAANKNIASRHYKVDSGLAAGNLILAALEEGIGSCIIESCDRAQIAKIINLPRDREIEFVIALGFSAEQPVFEEARRGSIKYYKDDRGILHVPKRPLEEVLRFNGYP